MTKKPIWFEKLHGPIIRTVYEYSHIFKTGLLTYDTTERCKMFCYVNMHYKIVELYYFKKDGTHASV